MASAPRVISVLAVIVILWWAQAVLIPIVVSLLISYALEPLIERLERWRIARMVAVPLVLGGVLMTAGAGAYLLRGEAAAFIQRLPQAAHTIAQTIQKATSKSSAPDTMAKVQAAARELETATKAAKPPANEDVTPVRIEEPTFKWSDWLWQGGYGATEFAAQAFVVLCLVFYMLVSGDLYKRKIVRMVPRLSDKKVTLQILAEVDRQIERFLAARVLISLVIGIMVWLAFRLIGIEEAGVWGVIAAVLYAIPIAGPTVVVLAAAIAGFAQSGSIGMAAAAGAICVAVGAFEGNVLTPWLMSRVGEMNAVAIFVSLLFWGWLWGIWGLLLAVPITAAIKAVCERIDDLAPVAELLKE